MSKRVVNPTTMARRVNTVVQTPTIFPEAPRSHLLSVYKESKSQCHPKLKSIRNGKAIFESRLDVQCTAECRLFTVWCVKYRWQIHFSPQIKTLSGSTIRRLSHM
jgi:hypothetical protein